MTPYLILAWNRQDVRANALAASVRSLLRAEHAHWRQLVDEPGRLIAVPGDGKAITGNLQGMPVFIIGDVFARSPDQTSAEHVLANAASFDDLCSQFAGDCWGAYVAVQLRDGGDISLFRDPIGMLDGFSWKTSGVNFFASAGMPWLGVCAPAGFGVDWQRAAQLLFDSGTLADTPPLKGISTLPPGALLDVRQGRRSVQRLWSPRNFHEYRSLDKPLPNALREIVLNCSQAWIERYPDNMIEISGGFDSAVVAASCRGMKRGVNFFTGQLSGDERRFARDIAAFQHIPLDEMFMPVGKLSETDLEGLPVDVRPGLSSATLFHDRPLTEIAAKRGVSALFTGHGGDSVFFQHPTAMIAADASFPRWDIGAHAALAKWSRESAWTVMSYAFHLPISRESRRSANDAIAALPMGMNVEPAQSGWAGEIADLPPAKRVQLEGIASDRGVLAPSWRSQALTLVHPLLSQPLVEFAIATDTFALTEGRRDRALARRAFSSLLPNSAIVRMGKGCLALYFGQCLCASVPFLRTYLLDGVLVREGVLDRGHLDRMLDVDYLMRFDCYAKLRSALVMEHWARVWQSRLAQMQSLRSLPDVALTI